MSVSQVFSFPDTVDEHAARLVASGVVVMSLAIVLGGQRWVLIPLAAGFVARVASGPRFSPLALAVTRVIVPRLPWSPKMTSGAPKRFAQGIGATLSAAALLAEYIVQSPGAATAPEPLLSDGRRGASLRLLLPRIGQAAHPEHARTLAQIDWAPLADDVTEVPHTLRKTVDLPIAFPRWRWLDAPAIDDGPALQALVERAGGRPSAVDRTWAATTRGQHQARADKLAASMASAAPGSDGLMHPNRLLAALRQALPADAIVIADGGDFLSFARVGLPASTYLDPGSLGCIGIGTPFGIAAALACPGRTVVVATGDGAFGFNAMEIDTAARHQVPVLIVVANNGSWAIEVRDQQETHGKVVGTRLQFADHAAMARAFNLYGERVERAEDLQGAIHRALAALQAGRPALLDVLVTPEAASSDARSGLAWVPDLQALGAWDDAERLWRMG